MLMFSRMGVLVSKENMVLHRFRLTPRRPNIDLWDTVTLCKVEMAEEVSA